MLGLRRVSLAVVVAAVMVAGASPANAAIISVSATTDDVDGNVSSPAALIADPGPDGTVSLREAILAADSAPGPHEITFASSLAGKTISLERFLPAITQEWVSVDGLLSGGGPAVTVDARQATTSASGVDYVFMIEASHVALRDLRVTGVAWPTLGMAVGISPGSPAPQYPTGPLTISDIQIENNVFDNTGFTFSAGGPRENGVEIHTTGYPGPGHVSDVLIAGNDFRNFTADAHSVGVVLGGDQASLTGLTIENNTFEEDDCCSVEFGAYGGTGSQLTDTQIVGNRFTNDSGAISLNIGASNTLFDNTLIARNVVSDSGPWPITISAGDALGTSAPTGNTIENTQIVNNLMAHDTEGEIGITGGYGSASVRDRVTDVALWNNTLFDTSATTLLALNANGTGAAGNSITGVDVRNSIFWAPGDNFQFTGASADVRNSLTTHAGFAGSNGNIAADPQFVNANTGDFELGAGSPAINAGVSAGAPTDDLLCRLRDGTPDMGAYEYGATPASCPIPDTTPPTTSIESGPSGPTNDPTSTFALSASETGSTFECRIDQGTPTSCASPYTTPSLSDGSHLLAAWAIDPAGNWDPVGTSQAFMIDTIAPRTLLRSGPQRRTFRTTATFRFASDEPGSTFECALDRGSFVSCVSPRHYSRLRRGRHVFEARATDAAGNVGQPAVRRWTIRQKS